MAKILEYRELPLSALLVDKGQVRTQDLDKEIDKLARASAAKVCFSPSSSAPPPRKANGRY